MGRRVDSYEFFAALPVPESIYVWELDKPRARELIEVVAVVWNGEEWWVRTKSLLPQPHPLAHFPGTPEATVMNDLSRFWEAVTPVRERHGIENVRRAALHAFELVARDEVALTPSSPVVPRGERHG